MQPVFLVPESVIHANGAGPVIDLGLSAPPSILITLGITQVVEQESLAVEIFGSADESIWAPAPLISIPQKFYAGVSAVVVDLAQHPKTRYLKAQWKVNRWGRGDATPLFGFYLFVEPAAVPTAN
jgi:hypothetical protein